MKGTLSAISPQDDGRKETEDGASRMEKEEST